MQTIVRAALRAASVDRITRCYFICNKKWEARFRNAFASLPGSIAADPAAARADAVKRLKRLAIDYRANRSSPNYELIFDAIAFEIENGWGDDPPSLLDGSNEDAERIAQTLNRVVDHAREKDEISKENHYSLATKCLHFMFPHSFAIYDSQALTSIATIAKNHADISFKRRFPASHLYLPSGYGKLLGFYREFWANVEQEKLLVDFTEAAGGLEKILSSVPECGAAQVTVVDLIDKWLYLSNGDRTDLGISTTA